MSIDLTKEQQCTLAANAEYQKIVPIIMNLATLSLALPIVFIKELEAPPNSKTSVHGLWPWAFVGWAFLGLALVCGCVFHFASAKLVKAIYGGYENGKTPSKIMEDRFERLRDRSGEWLVPFFLLGLVFTAVFLVTHL
jgi:hypothetical protein